MELYRLGDQSGAIKFTRTERVVRSGRANKCRLESNNAMNLDDGFQNYCWIGKNASSAERCLAMAYAMRHQGQETARLYVHHDHEREQGEPAVSGKVRGSTGRLLRVYVTRRRDATLTIRKRETGRAWRR